MTQLRVLLLTLTTLLVTVPDAFAQKKYQSLMWKITGNGLTKPSYLYGTMHVSGKMVFHLGDHFYDAIEGVDIVALELEPEAWLQSIFDDKSSGWYSRSAGEWDNDFYYDSDEYLAPLKGVFGLNTDIQDKVKNALMYDPSLLNYMLFRYSNYGAGSDYEEETWLDMYIYQVGKKLGKQTFGLETYEQSTAFLEKAQEEERKNYKKKSYDSRDREEIERLQNQMEPAYRRQDLDLIDSLNKKTTSEAFDKYILVERNKVFVHNMDSLLRNGKTLLAGMGCAHLPGDSGVVEMMRRIGYTVEYYNKGERNAQRRSKLEKIVYKRNYKTYTTTDQQLTFDAPSEVYPLFTEKDQSAWISLDIPNGSSFIVYRTKNYAGLRRIDNNYIFASIDSILYEAVAGNIVSQKKITVQGYQALDIVNVTRRGDYQRKMIVLLPEEILVLKLTSTGEKVKNGYGNEFFKTLKINLPKTSEVNSWQSQDKRVTLNMPGYVSYYAKEINEFTDPDFLVTSHEPVRDEYYMAQRHTTPDPEFIDEELYELNRLADAYSEDNHLTENYRKETKHLGYQAIKGSFTSKKGRQVYSLFLIQNLNYHAFTAITTDSARAEEYFQKINLTTERHEQYYMHTDTTLKFSVKIPYKPEPKKKNESFYDWYSNSNSATKNSFLGESKSTSLTPPGSTDIIYVNYQRYHRFSDAQDKETYITNRDNEVSNYGDLKIDQKTITNTPTGMEILYQLSDTASTRKIITKQILHNKSLYQLSSSYDSIAGVGSFISKAFETFKPIDTTFAFSHFENMDDEYLDALLSSDSTTHSNALDLVDEMDFEAGSAQRLRTIITDLPKLKNEKEYQKVKKNLTMGLSADSSMTNLNFLRDQFYNNTDSTDYQIVLLRTLLKIKTKDSFLTYKKLVLDDPPITRNRNGNGTFELLYDSLELAKLLMPEIQQTVALNEYEIPTYGLMATLLDSSLINKSSYEKQIDLILLEAKNEYKRLNAADEDGYGFDTNPLMNYCSLLQPFRSKPEIDAFFKKIYRTKKTKLLLELAEFEIRHKQTVADSILQRIVLKQERVIPLYNMLYENKMADKFPNKYGSREELIKLYIILKFSNKNDEDFKVDTVNIFQIKETTLRNKKLDVYYCKYKQKKGDQWKGIILAFEKTESGDMWPRFLERSKTIIIDPHENEIEELDREYKLLVEENRREFDWSDGNTYSTYSWD